MNATTSLRNDSFKPKIQADRSSSLHRWQADNDVLLCSKTKLETLLERIEPTSPLTKVQRIHSSDTTIAFASVNGGGSQKKTAKTPDKTNDDYYSILGLTKTATDADIKKAYKKQAFLYHPDKNSDPDSSRRFAKISAAFDVLSNPNKRHLYDMYGLDGVKRSATFYSGSTRKDGSFYDDQFNAYVDETGARVVYKDPPIYHDLLISLEEIVEGTKKKVKITRKVFVDDKNSKLEEKILSIQIKPGWKAGTKIIFEREGDRRPGVIPADIIFILKDKPHPVFKRNASDVIYTARINLKSALLGDQLLIPLLSKEKKLLKWTDIINPRSEKRLRGFGLPNSSIPGSRGDLIVRFDIIFPKQLSTEERQLLNCAIPPFFNHEDL